MPILMESVIICLFPVFGKRGGHFLMDSGLMFPCVAIGNLVVDVNLVNVLPFWANGMPMFFKWFLFSLYCTNTFIFLALWVGVP